MAESLNNEEIKLRNNLRKMIKSFDSYIKEADDYEQLEDNLKHMEETDENFHKYDMVEMITDRIEALLGNTIDKSVNETFNTLNDENKFDGDVGIQNKMAQKITDEIMKSKEFVEFRSTFKTNVLKANDYLMKNFHSSFIESNSEEVTIHDNENKSISFTNDFDYVSPNNSITQVNSFVFLTSEQFPVIAQNLDPRKPDQVRLRAIQQILSIPASDPQAVEHWVDIRSYLNSCLKDQNQNIADLCLKLHSRTLASSHYKVSVEIYKNLVEHLSEYFRDKELEKRTLKPHIDMSSADNSFLLKIFRLINDYSKDIITKWARYPEDFIESIINQTLKLFCALSDQKLGNYMTPLHYISLLDIQSNWFVKWMHGHDSRKVLIESIKKNELFLQASVSSIISYLNGKRTENTSSLASSHPPVNQPQRKKSISNVLSNTINNTNSIKKRVQFRKAELEYAHFLHSLNVIKKILCFKNGRRLFPIKIANKEVTLKELIKTIIQIIFETASFRTANEYSPSKQAYDLLQDLCVTEETCEACLCNEDVIDLLIKPLKNIMQIKKPSTSSSTTSNQQTSTNTIIYDESCMFMVANVLSKLASTQSGFRQLIYNDARKNFGININKNTAAHTIVAFVRKALTNQLNYSISTCEIAEYLYLARLLYSNCQGVFLIKEYDLNRCISESWRLSDKEKHSTPNTPRQLNTYLSDSKQMFSLTWSDSLLDNLVVMASTPKGVIHLNETGLVNQVINYMFIRYKSKFQIGKYEKFGYGFIISQLSNTPSGCFYLNESSFIQYLIDEIWTELECGSDDFMSAFPRSYSVEILDREVYKPMLCLINIISSFYSAYELLYDVTITPRQHYGAKDKPKGLIGLLDRVVFLDRKAKIVSLTNYEQSHVFGLRFLSYLICDLDVLLLIESQYNASELLLNLQKANKINSMNFGQDESNDLNTNEDNVDDDEISNDSKRENSQSEIIIDMLSVERNFVLVNANLIGGPNEKRLPSRSLSENKNKPFNYPLFEKLPVPDFYIKKIDVTISNQPSDQSFNEFLTNFNYDKTISNTESITKWLNNFKNLFENTIKSSSLNQEVLKLSLEQMTLIMNKTEINNLIPNNDFKNLNDFLNKSSSLISAVALSNIQILGAKKSIKYGTQLGLLDSSLRDTYFNKLCDIHKMIKVLLSKTSKTSKKECYLNYCLEDSSPSYDWFTSTIFLLNKGDFDSTTSFMFNFHSLKLSSFVWPSRLYSTDLLSSVYNKNGISILLSTTCHYIEHILKIEQPFIYSAFRMSGLSPSQICLHWLKQCFWNYLDWMDIITYITICISFGSDYQTYFCIAILKHLNEKNEESIVQHHTNKDLQFYLKETQIENFKIEQHIDYMRQLEQKYRQYILDDIQETFNKA